MFRLDARSDKNVVTLRLKNGQSHSPNNNNCVQKVKQREKETKDAHSHSPHEAKRTHNKKKNNNLAACQVPTGCLCVATNISLAFIAIAIFLSISFFYLFSVLGVFRFAPFIHHTMWPNRLSSSSLNTHTQLCNWTRTLAHARKGNRSPNASQNG